VKKYIVVHNSLDSRFSDNNCKAEYSDRSNIVLVASLKKYKGVYNFIELAKLNPNIQFNLILNISVQELSKFISCNLLPINLKINSFKKDLINIYSHARILMVMSIPPYWIETFGMTIIEAFSCGTPAIVPNIGGPKEIVEDNLNGYLINDITDLNILSLKIQQLYFSEYLWNKFSEKAILTSKRFSNSDFNLKIDNFITNCE
jgi:glycosyltransferase involved in cell wall biosynthesis